jgi:hypothetical protein
MIEYISVSPAVPDREAGGFSQNEQSSSQYHVRKDIIRRLRVEKERRDENWKGGGKLSISKAAKGSAFGLRSGMRSEVRFATKPKSCKYCA